MRVHTNNFKSPHAGRSDPTWNDEQNAEWDALGALVDQFAKAMKQKLRNQLIQKRKSGWDNPSWSEFDIVAQIRAHVDKGDPVDVANFAAFLWNRKDKPAPPDQKVWCKECRAEKDVNGETCLQQGWPKCCGYTMTIDHPSTW